MKFDKVVIILQVLYRFNLRRTNLKGLPSVSLSFAVAITEITAAIRRSNPRGAYQK